jgi:hypothetical protein
MLDKLKLWNYVSLLSSQCQYYNNKNFEKSEFLLNVLDNLFNVFSNEELDWLADNVFNAQIDWEYPIKAASVTIDLIQNIDKPIIQYDSMSGQLSLEYTYKIDNKIC